MIYSELLLGSLFIYISTSIAKEYRINLPEKLLSQLGKKRPQYYEDEDTQISFIGQVIIGKLKKEDHRNQGQGNKPNDVRDDSTTNLEEQLIKPFLQNVGKINKGRSKRAISRFKGTEKAVKTSLHKIRSGPQNDINLKHSTLAAPRGKREEATKEANNNTTVSDKVANLILTRSDMRKEDITEISTSTERKSTTTFEEETIEYYDDKHKDSDESLSEEIEQKNEEMSGNYPMMYDYPTYYNPKMPYYFMYDTFHPPINLLRKYNKTKKVRFAPRKKIVQSSVDNRIDTPAPNSHEKYIRMVEINPQILTWSAERGFVPLHSKEWLEKATDPPPIIPSLGIITRVLDNLSNLISRLFGRQDNCPK